MNVRKELPSLALMVLFCLIVAAAALLLVPSPTHLALLDEPVILWELDTGYVNEWGEPELLTVTAYTVCIAASAVAAVALTALLSRLYGRSFAQGAATAALSGLLALLGAHWLYCALQWGNLVADCVATAAFPLQFWKGCYTMYGAILGALLGGVVSAKLQKLSVGRVMDMLIPGMLIVLIVGRLGEFYTSEGIASQTATEAFKFLPFRKPDWRGDNYLAVNAYEAFVGCAALLAVAGVLLCRKPAGRASEAGLTIVSAGQIVLESLRNDNAIDLANHSFVHWNMIAAAVTLAFIFVTRVVRRVRCQGWKAWETVRIILFALGCGVVVLMEFAIGGKINALANVSELALYITEALAATAMMLSVVIGDGRVKEAQ